MLRHLLTAWRHQSWKPSPSVRIRKWTCKIFRKAGVCREARRSWESHSWGAVLRESKVIGGKRSIRFWNSGESQCRPRPRPIPTTTLCIFSLSFLQQHVGWKEGKRRRFFIYCFHVSIWANWSINLTHLSYLACLCFQSCSFWIYSLTLFLLCCFLCCFCLVSLVYLGYLAYLAYFVFPVCLSIIICPDLILCRSFIQSLSCASPIYFLTHTPISWFLSYNHGKDERKYLVLSCLILPDWARSLDSIYQWFFILSWLFIVLSSLRSIYEVFGILPCPFF